MSTESTFQNEFRFVFFAPPEKFEATISFYRDVLGFPITGGFGDTTSEMRGSYVQAAKGIIEIIADRSESELMRAVLKPGEAFQPARGGYFLIEVENVETKYEQLITQGVEIAQPIKDWPWGFRDFKIQDPCGNVLCLFSRRSA